MLIPTQYFMSTYATYTTMMAFTVMLNILALWAMCTFLSITIGFFAKKYGKKAGQRLTEKEEFSSINEDKGKKFFEISHQADNEGERRTTGEFYITPNDHKHRLLRYFSSFFSWLAWVWFAGVPTCYSAFNLLPIALGVIISFLILLMRYAVSLYTNCPLGVTRGKRLYRCYGDVIKTMFRLHKKMAIFGLFCVAGVAVFINMGTYKSCVNDHIDATYGITFDNGGSKYFYSSALIRAFTIDKVCPPGPPCHVYATLPFDTSSSVFLNVHTHVDVTSVTMNYDTQANYNTTNNYSMQAATSYMVSPSGYDMKGERNIHTILLTGLQPDEIYSFELYYDGASQYQSTYQTLPGENSTSSYNLIYGGDMGVSPATDIISEVIAQQQPRALMIGGDLAYDNGEAYCYYNMDLTLNMLETNIFQRLGRVVPITLSVGNHDVGFDSLADVNMDIDENGPSYYLGFPQHYPQDSNGITQVRVPAVTERLTYHSHMIGNLLNVVLDPGYMTPYNGAQLDWLVNTSTTFNSYAKVGVYHDPIISACLSSYSADSVEDGLTYWIPTFDEFNYMVVFEHHSHTFKKSYPLRNLTYNANGTIYLGEGDWGVNPAHCDFDNSKGYLEAYASINHIWVVNVNQANSTITYSALLQNGSAYLPPFNQTTTTYSLPNGDDDL